MPNEAHDELDETLIRQHLSDVTAKNTAWVLLQEPGFIGFGAVYRDKICWPPHIQQLDWARIRDLRLFGEKGEWHVWLHWDGTWQSRLLKSEEMTDTLTEYHALWGNDVKPDTPPWIKLVEDRGTEIWLPLKGLVANADLPLRLKLKQVVDYDPKYHLAGIVDAALIGPQILRRVVATDRFAAFIVIMLQNFRFARYRFTYTVQEPLKMPRYKGNVFRGRLGYILRGITCVRGTRGCEQQCQFPEGCVYSKCFETPVPDDSPILRGQPFAPHPFVLEPPHTGKLKYAPGDTFACNLILIGEAIDLLPWMVFTFHEIGKRRIGLRDQRGGCQLEKVESLPARVNHRCQTIYTAETEMLTDEGLILRLDDVMEDAPHATDTTELQFLTPTSIKLDGRWTSNLTFEHFIRNLLRRIRFLSYFHCGEDLDVDAPGLIESARSIRHEFRFYWVRKDRYSHRTETSIPMDGFIGKVRFEGNLEPFLPFILLGEYLHIGHHTAFGYGQYRLTSACGSNLG